VHVLKYCHCSLWYCDVFCICTRLSCTNS